MNGMNAFHRKQLWPTSRYYSNIHVEVISWKPSIL